MAEQTNRMLPTPDDAPTCEACCIGVLIHPCEWWRDTLKQKRCTWCGDTKYDRVLEMACNAAMRGEPT
jgi:hypothetical protein